MNSQSSQTPELFEPRPDFWNSWLSALLISVVGVPLLFFLWGRTGEILQDFGNDLYYSSQICQGKILYRDITCLYGPLSPYFNAAVMRIFGPGLHVILITNLFILILIVFLLYRLLNIIAGSFVASVAIAFFLCVFAMAAPTRITNYNFLTPYAHQITHGFLLCLLVLCCIDCYLQKPSLPVAAAGGFLVGLAFLTKVEIFLGCGAAFAIGFAAALWIHSFKRAFPAILIALAAMLAPVLIALLYFASVMPFHAAWNGLFGSWQYMREPYVLSAPFYRGSLGIDEPLRNFLLMMQYAGFYAAGVIVLGVIAFAVPKALFNIRYGVAAFGILLCAATLFLIHQAGDRFANFWIDAARGMPIFVFFTLIRTALSLWKSRDNSEVARRSLLEFSFAVLAFFFLAKIILCARFYQYGFVLAAPAAILAAVALLRSLPGWIARRGGSAALIRFGAVGILVAFALEFITITSRVLSERTLPVPLPRGETAWTTPGEADVVSAIQYLAHYPSATLAVVPDAVGVNYATGRQNSVPYIFLNPMTLQWFNESIVIAAFRQNPPRFILITIDSDDAFGAHRFGADFGLELNAWITQNYKPLATFSTTARPAELLIRR